MMKLLESVRTWNINWDPTCNLGVLDLNAGLGPSSLRGQTASVSDIDCPPARCASSNLRLDAFEEPPALEQPFLIVHPGHGSDIAWRPTENQLLQVSGVIAQDVETVLPELVAEDAEGYKAVAFRAAWVTFVARVSSAGVERRPRASGSSNFELAVPAS